MQKNAMAGIKWTAMGIASGRYSLDIALALVKPLAVTLYILRMKPRAQMIISVNGSLMATTVDITHPPWRQPLKRMVPGASVIAIARRATAHHMKGAHHQPLKLRMRAPAPTLQKLPTSLPLPLPLPYSLILRLLPMGIQMRVQHMVQHMVQLELELKLDLEPLMMLVMYTQANPVVTA